MVKRFFVAAVCAVALFSSTPAQAAPILTPDSDGVVGTVVFDLLGTPLAIAIAGASGANVTDGVLLTSGVIAAADTDTALFVDFGVDDAYVFDFDYSSSVFGPGGVWTLLAVGTPLLAADPSLLPFFGINVAQFSFLGAELILGQEQEVLGVIGTYALDFIAAPEATAVPEPATLGLLGAGLLAAARRRRAGNKAA